MFDHIEIEKYRSTVVWLMGHSTTGEYGEFKLPLNLDDFNFFLGFRLEIGYLLSWDWSWNNFL